MRSEDYRRLFGFLDPNTPHSGIVMTPLKRLGRWLSTVHYDSAETEARLQGGSRQRLTGGYVRSRYALVADFNTYVVLTPR